MKTPKRPRDPNVLVKTIIDLATGNTTEPLEKPLSAAAELGQEVARHWQKNY